MTDELPTGCDREDCCCVPFDWTAAFSEPWLLSVCDDGYPMVHTAGDVICVDEPNHRPGCPWQLARFHMLRTAPAMYAALEALDRSWTESFPGGPDGERAFAGGVGRLSDETVDLWRTIRAALAQARGEQL